MSHLACKLLFTLKRSRLLSVSITLLNRGYSRHSGWHPDLKMIPKVTLNNGLEIPIIGLGTWKSQPGVVTQAVKDAIDVGYRHIDCAHVYGNEKEVGAGINAKIKEGVVQRKDLFITSKLWDSHHHPDFVVAACMNTLKDLGLDYLDLYLMHYPIAYKAGFETHPTDENGKLMYSTDDYVDTWKAMEKLVDRKLVRSIGLSNFNSKQIERVLDVATIKPAMLQIECHPYLNQKKLIAFGRERGMSITAYSPLGSKDRPWAKPGEPVLLEDKKLHEMSTRLSRTPAQIVLRYQIQRGNVVIPKSVHKTRILENFAVFDFELSQEDMQLLDSFDKNTRFCTEPSSVDHPDYPFNLEF
ncbi:aldo-keto reductase family 1 member B1-like [Neocloeon triangulifer]|uniref:aldo-keto reductase family 1 member B1-like n=1 Tax=Neocloeon triangulifer TaxID=2078957 RepID=UPI00286F9E3A|nr:aldo-keto reductase family 1 member B1-like [Neocloeon triangulifer]XP_059474493.1 aldo-keto reductase family 1 member B1-like [Neocloeon triangulifer]XP_059474494.1 aldo-keto reductase family 1 member B1-like [Neocloeon triangulifer]XP_059474495.1 aldo-keto reductase family 1 member B1-like [Neocloeon triangulifer]